MESFARTQPAGSAGGFQEHSGGKPGVWSTEGEMRPTLTPMPYDTLPDWKPASLFWLPHILGLALSTIVTYIVLFAISHSQGIICADSTGAGIVFLHGPALVGLVIGELLGRMATDFDSIRPFQELTLTPSKRSDNLEAELSLAEPEGGMWNTIVSFFWPINPLKITKLWVSVVLIPLLSASFQAGTRDVDNSPGDFRVVGIGALLSSLNGSMIPSIGIPALLRADIFNNLWWITSFDSGQDFDPIGPYWAGVLPFAPLENGAYQASPGGSQLWTVPTSAIFGSLDCIPLDLDANVTNLNVQGATATGALQLSMSDGNGCLVSSSWANFSTSEIPSLNNPVLFNGSSPAVALWAGWTAEQSGRSGMPAQTTVSGSCGDARYFIVSGPLPKSSAPGETTLGTGPGSGWSGLACTTSYSIIDQLGWPINPNSYDAQYEGNLQVGQGSKLPTKQSDMIDAALLANFVSTGVLYSLTDPGYGAAFWRGQTESVYDPDDSDFLAALVSGGVLPRDCSSVPGGDAWSVDDCEAYQIALSTWSFLVAGLPYSQSPFLPVDDWKTAQGTLTQYKTGWYLDDTGFGVALVLLFISFGPLLAASVSDMIGGTNILGLPPLFSVNGRRNRTTSIRTGLYNAASSIAGLAFYFRDPKVRTLFQGIDAMENDKATEELRHRLDSDRVSLKLGRWRAEMSSNAAAGETTYSIIRDEKGQETAGLVPAAGDHAIRSADAKSLSKLFHGPLPFMLTPKLLLPLVFVLAVIVVVVFIYIIRPSQTLFALWKQSADSDSARQFLQRMFFSGLPPLILAILSIWWSSVDSFFRVTQPFAALKRKVPGAKSIGLTYMHDMDGVVSFRAFRNGHLWLALITIITVLGKAGVFLAAGVFKMTDQVSSIDNRLAYSSYWQNGTFPAGLVSESSYALRFQESFLSLLIFDTESLYGWTADYYLFPTLLLKEPWYQMSIVGLRGSLDCQTSAANTTIDNVTGEWTTTLVDGECAGSKFTRTAANPQESISYLTWLYLNRDSCSGMPRNESGRWWIQNGLIKGSMTSVTSLLCTPSFSFDTVNITVLAADADSDTLNDNAPFITLNSVVSQTPLDSNYWKADGTASELEAFVQEYGNDSISFFSFASAIINSSLSPGNLYQASPNLYLDYPSVMAVSMIGNSTGSGVELTDTVNSWLFSASDLATLSSDVFGLAINVLGTLDVNPVVQSDGDWTTIETVLLQNASLPDPWPTQQHVQKAFVQSAALYAAVGVLLLYLAVIPILLILLLLAPSWKTWRPPRRLERPANDMAMLYDSSLMDRPLATDGGATSWEEVRWGFGLFQGSRTGEWRVGIEDSAQL